MKEIFYISIVFTAEEEKTAMISALLMSNGFEGAVETGKETNISIPEELYIEKEVFEIFDRLKVAYEVKRIQQQNWNAVWESSFEPVQVDKFVRVRASFHEPDTEVKYDITITPKMSFGTGHHATTYLMMQEMSLIEFQGKDVIDFGTGTGVLAILAEKMGARNVEAIDNDDWSIANARENFKENSCSKINLIKDNSLQSYKPADVVLANINLNIILKNIEYLKSIIKPHGAVLLSGLLIGDKERICKALSDNDFIVKKLVDKNNWLMILVSL